MRIFALAALALVAAGCGGPSGSAVFDRACAKCHATDAAPGGSLRGYHLTRAEIESFTRVMPGSAKLSDAEIRAVSKYVESQERRAP